MASALWAGPGAVRALHGSGTVEVALHPGGYVRLGDEYVLVAVPRAPRGPLTLLVSGLEAHPLAPGDRAYVNGALHVGRHTMDSIVQGADGRLYVGVGSRFDNHGLPGRVVSWVPGRHTPRLEATGLRNPYGLAFHGADLLVTDNGRDDLGETRPPEELDRFDPAGPVADFGFPRCSPSCSGAIAPIATFPAHASTDGLAVKGGFAYVAQNGSTIRRHAVGSDVQRVNLATGNRTRLWKSPVAHDPLGAAIGPDGRLYVTLFVTGRVVSFKV